jgi:hypothetical protein
MHNHDANRQLKNEILNLQYIKGALERSQDKYSVYKSFITDDLNITQLKDLKEIHQSLINDKLDDKLSLKEEYTSGSSSFHNEQYDEKGINFFQTLFQVKEEIFQEKKQNGDFHITREYITKLNKQPNDFSKEAAEQPLSMNPIKSGDECSYDSMEEQDDQIGPAHLMYASEYTVSQDKWVQQDEATTKEIKDDSLCWWFRVMIFSGIGSAGVGFVVGGFCESKFTQWNSQNAVIGIAGGLVCLFIAFGISKIVGECCLGKGENDNNDEIDKRFDGLSQS